MTHFTSTTDIPNFQKINAIIQFNSEEEKTKRWITKRDEKCPVHGSGPTHFFLRCHVPGSGPTHFFRPVPFYFFTRELFFRVKKFWKNIFQKKKKSYVRQYYILNSSIVQMRWSVPGIMPACEFFCAVMFPVTDQRTKTNILDQRI